MLDKFLDRLMESATADCMPKLEELAKARRAELVIKAKVTAEPDQVEAWFDKEIEKLDSMDVNDIMKNATAGI